MLAATNKNLARNNKTASGLSNTKGAGGRIVGNAAQQKIRLVRRCAFLGRAKVRAALRELHVRAALMQSKPAARYRELQTGARRIRTLSRLAKTQADRCETKRTGRDGGLTSSATLFMKQKNPRRANV